MGVIGKLFLFFKSPVRVVQKLVAFLLDLKFVSKKTLELVIFSTLSTLFWIHIKKNALEIFRER